jgi:hypothetical protein
MALSQNVISHSHRALAGHRREAAIPTVSNGFPILLSKPLKRLQKNSTASHQAKACVNETSLHPNLSFSLADYLRDVLY